MRNTAGAFTLIELLIAVAVIGIVSAAILFTLSDAPEVTRRAVLQNDVKTIEGFIEAKRQQGSGLEEITRAVAETEGGDIRAKVIGSFEYLKEIYRDSSERICDKPSNGDLYGFLADISGTAPETTFSTINSKITTVNSENDFYCVHSPTSKEFSIAVRVDKKTWWCGSTERPEKTGYYIAGQGENLELWTDCRTSTLLTAPSEDF